MWLILEDCGRNPSPTPHTHLNQWGGRQPGELLPQPLSLSFWSSPVQPTCLPRWCCPPAGCRLCCVRQWSCRENAAFTTTPRWTAAWTPSPCSSTTPAAGPNSPSSPTAHYSIYSYPTPTLYSLHSCDTQSTQYVETRSRREINVWQQGGVSSGLIYVTFYNFIVFLIKFSLLKLPYYYVAFSVHCVSIVKETSGR